MPPRLISQAGIWQYRDDPDKNLHTMKKYTIAFMDNDYNDLIVKKVQFNNLKEAKAFAKVYLANLCDNDVKTFRIY
jgi:hypothetical protein